MTVLLEFDPTEAELLRTLLAQYEELISDGDDAAEPDPALDRLFPVAYPDDSAASKEFRRYTRSGLVDSKTANAGAVSAALAADGVVSLTDEEAERWLPVLTDLRLVLAERLGIRSDEDQPPDDALGEIYDWLGQLQWFLVAALERNEP